MNEALDAGVDMEIIKSIPRDGEFTMENVEKKLLPTILKIEGDGNGDDKERGNGYKNYVLVRFVTAILCHSGVICDELYEEAKKVLGEGKDEVLVEITSIVGYYTFVAYTLNVFRIPST